MTRYGSWVPPRPRPARGDARVLLVDNYDSFVFNLVQAFGVLGAETVVRRNDAVDAGAALALMQVPEPWPASIGRRRLAARETYPRFTPRELRSLTA